MNKQTFVTNKWIKTGVLVKSSYLAAHIPTTLRLSRETLSRLLRKHRMVYVKPVSGSRGLGVMRVDQLQGKWSIHEGEKRRLFATFDKLYLWLSHRIRKTPYIVQQGIHMLKHRGRPTDFRVVIQKGKKAMWKVTGIAARVAHPLKAVTNGSQGGSIHPAKRLLQRTAGGEQTTRLLSQFNRMARITAQRFSSTYPRMNELGLDIAVDRKHRPWILEVNTMPDPCPFTKLADCSMIREMVRYARAYGRTYSLNCNKAKRGR